MSGQQHEPECDAGPDDNGWQPPCNGDSCSYCWDREDNCKCRCEWIRMGLKRGYRQGRADGKATIHDCGQHSAMCCSASYRRGYNDHARAQQHWQDTHGAYRQHGEGENP